MYVYACVRAHMCVEALEKSQMKNQLSRQEARRVLLVLSIAYDNLIPTSLEERELLIFISLKEL